MSIRSLSPTVAPPSPARRVPSLVVTPAVVAHRGASGHRPEHTLDAYRTAVRMGADAIEIDLVPTADGALVARHEHELSRTTDIAARPALAHLRTTRTVAGETRTGWFSEDLTLAQVKTLTARERMPDLRPRNTSYDGDEGVPALSEVLAMLAAESARAGRTVGLMVELKQPAYFAGRGIAVDEALLAVLARHGLDHPRAPVTLMSFEEAVLRRLAARTRLPLVRLLDRGDDVGPAALDAIDTYADGIGAHLDLVVPPTAGRWPAGPSDLVREAHRRWLTVHAWTLRAENHYLPPAHRTGPDPAALGDVGSAAEALLTAGVDGLITDHPDLVLPARDAAR